jgi:glutamyl-tRNA synthetase
VRTALFNWLFARAHGGRFILRIDDTDAKRNVDQALAPILRGFRWLGIEWDEGGDIGGEFGPYHQSQRAELYQEAVARLLELGDAYYDYARPEEVAAERDAARERQEPFFYSRKWMATTAAERERFAAEGRQAVVRLKMPREGECRFHDLVRGEMSFAWAQEMDHVIQRADGSCLYHLANVVDDHAMRISHVIRAEEHLSNTPRQIFIAQGLGYELAQYAHLPYVAEPGSKRKLSKRKLAKYLKNQDFAKLNEHGARIAAALGMETAAETFNPVIVDFYEAIGFLPQALVNYLLLLGWALDDRTEFLSREQMVELFSLERVNKAPASFDPGKLMAFQEHYMQALPLAERVARVWPFAERVGWGPRERVAALVAAAGERIKVAGDLLNYPEFFCADEVLEYEAKALRKRVFRDPDTVGLLARLQVRLAAAYTFDEGAVGDLLHRFVEAEGIKIGQIIHALRVAVTGKAVGFGLFEGMAILGREACVRRIERLLALPRPSAE